MNELGTCRVLVTGADTTARVISECFLAAGARVFACDVRRDAVDALCAAHPAMDAVVADVSVEDDVTRLVAAAESHMGGIDALINVVGVAGPVKPVEDITLDEWRSTFAVNMDGVFLTARAVAPGMKARRQGSIINISTASTRTLPVNRSPYISSKAAVEGLTRALARELGPHNVRVNAILPGGINGERMRAIFHRMAEERGISDAQFAEEALKYVSMRTLIEPSEIADMALFLCSDRARHITGQLIAVDGHSEWEQ